MNCPSCPAQLQITERAGIEIDYCPSCRGVWLDKGELDKIIERSAAHVQPSPHGQPPAQAQPGQFQQPERESWLERVFDIFD